MSEVFHYFSGDLSLSATGDLLLADGTEESKQRVLRRLLTNPEDYLWQPDYGAGLPTYIGAVLDEAELGALIRAQMYLEQDVAQDPPPDIALRPIANGIAAQITYQALDEPTSLSFRVSP